VKNVFSFLAKPVTCMLACCVKHIVEVAAVKQKIIRIITVHSVSLAITTIAVLDFLAEAN